MDELKANIKWKCERAIQNINIILECNEKDAFNIALEENDRHLIAAITGVYGVTEILADTMQHYARKDTEQ